MATTEQDRMAQQVAGQTPSGEPKRLCGHDEGKPSVELSRTELKEAL